MDTVSTIRWMVIGLHVIVATFGIVMTANVLDYNLLAAMERSSLEPLLKRVLLLSAPIIVGNLVGVALLSSRLFNSFKGVCALAANEFCFLITTLFS